MARRDKLLAWGCQRLQQHEQEMASLLHHLYEERSQTASSHADPDLDEIIHVIEAEKDQATIARQRLLRQIDRDT